MEWGAAYVMRSRTRIAFVITGTNTGGAEMMLLKLLERLSTEFEPFVFSLIPIGEIGERIRGLGVPVESLDMSPTAPSPLAVVTLTRRLRQLKPDLVHTWMYHSDLTGGIAARMAGVRSVAWCIRHGDLSRKDTKMQTLLVARVCALLSRWIPDGILCCSEESRRAHVRGGYSTRNMVVIPNGFDIDRFGPNEGDRSAVRAELKVDSNALLVGLIGRLNVLKNHEGFFEAAARVHCMKPEARFVLVGRDVESTNPALVAMVKKAGLLPFTHLLGRRDDVPRIMAALDVLASSSSSEGFPNVIGEAMACGVPCAVTDVGDCREIVGDSGRVVDSHDMVALGEAIVSLLNLRPEERVELGRRARRRISEHFEIGAVTLRYEEFFRELIARETQQ